MRRADELLDLMAGYFASFTSGDPAWVDRHVVDGEELRLIGTNEEEWLQGATAFERFRSEAASTTGSLEASVDDLEAYSVGDVGWGSGKVRFRLRNGPFADARFSVVFVVMHGTWKLVSSHTSIAVPDDEAFSEY